MPLPSLREFARPSAFRLIGIILATLIAGAAHALPVVEKVLPMGNNTAGIVTDPGLGTVYVTNFDDGTVTVVDIGTLSVGATFPLGPHPRRLVGDAAHHIAFVAMATTPGSVAWGEATTSAVGSIATGNNTRTIGSNFMLGYVYATNVDDKTVSVINTTTRAVVATIPVGAGAGTPVSNGILNKLYVPNGTDGTVTVIDEITLKVLKTVAVGKGPVYCAVDAQHGKVYVNNATDATISVIDSTTDTVVKTIASGTGSNSNFGTISAVYRRYYLPNSQSGTLTIVNTDTDTVTHTVPVGTTPIEAQVDANGGDVYVVNQGSNSVTVINAATETVVGAFAVGGAPWRMSDALGHLFILNTNGAAVDTMTIATENNSIKNTAVATEFYHADFNHYFHTAGEVETRVLIDGLFHEAWHRTFQFFRVWTTAAPGRFPVSRFFSTQWGTKSSHFFTANQNERNQLVAGTIPGWQLEADAVYYIGLADPAGNCPAGTVPLYRLYNNGQGGAPNHRLVSDRATRDAMVAQGWVGEGSGPDTVYGCTPTLQAG